MYRNTKSILLWLFLTINLMEDGAAIENSMIYMYEEGTGFPFYCTFGTQKVIEERPKSVQRECLKRHNGMVHLLPDGTPTFPFLKYGTPGGIVLDCLTNVKHGSLDSSCSNHLVHSTCQFTCDPGYRPVSRSDRSPTETNISTASCDLTGPRSNISVEWSHICELEDTTEDVGNSSQSKEEDLLLTIILISLAFIVMVAICVFVLFRCIQKKGSFCKTERCLTPTDSTRSDIATAVSSSQSVEKGTLTDPIEMDEFPSSKQCRTPSFKTMSSIPSNFGKSLTESIDQGSQTEQNSDSKSGSVGLTDLHINELPSGVLQIGEPFEPPEQRDLYYQGQANKEDDMADPAPPEAECQQPLLPKETDKVEKEESVQGSRSSLLTSLVDGWKEPLSINEQEISLNPCNIPTRGVSTVPPSTLSVNEIQKMLEGTEERLVLDVEEGGATCSTALNHMPVPFSFDEIKELLETKEERDTQAVNREGDASLTSMNSLPGCNVRELKKANGTDYQAILDELEPQDERLAEKTLEGYFFQTHEQLQRLGFRDRDHYELIRMKYRNRPDWDFSKYLLDKMAQHGDTIPNLVEYLKNRNIKAHHLITKVHICNDCSKHY